MLQLDATTSRHPSSAVRPIALTTGDVSTTTRTAIQTSTTEAFAINPAPPPAHVPAGSSGNGNPSAPAAARSHHVPETIAAFDWFTQVRKTIDGDRIRSAPVF